jgi:murein DD-endopeptidase MepM/ murein hydrolase activator NlpD
MSGHARFKRGAILAALALCGAVGAFATMAPPAELLVSRTAALEPVPLAVENSILPAPASYVREERYERGDTLAGLLARLAVGEADARALSLQPKMRLLRPGTSVIAEVRSDGTLVSLGFLAPRDLLVKIESAGAGFRAIELRAPFVTVPSMKSAVIRSSLFAAADAAGVPESVAVQLAEVFGGDIDFHRDLRQDDRFSVVYEMQYLEGRPVRAGRLLAAEFVNQRRTHRAVWFPGTDGKGGYYAPDGKNLRKAFLRSPLEFSRVSSGFGVRMHPFLLAWKAHKGVDYAAPGGTRVRSAGDGVIAFAGRQGGYGNMVVVRHQGQYATVYAHLSGFARGIRRGARIAQGEIIGFVGQSGWATGPHLHYEFRVAGEARNPLTIALPAALPVAAGEMKAFRALAWPLTGHLDLLSNSQLAALE